MSAPVLAPVLIPPPDPIGAAYRASIEALVLAVAFQAAVESKAERAKEDVALKRKELHEAVEKLVAREVQKKLGPDGGK